MATTPAAGPSPSAARKALAKAAKAFSISSGSSRRNSREKQSWLGAPCGKSTISPRPASLALQKSAISTQLFAPHRVAIKATNSIEAQSCRAFKSRGSRTSRRIEINFSIEASSNQEASQESFFILPAIAEYLYAIPLRNGGGGPCEAWWRGLRS